MTTMEDKEDRSPHKQAADSAEGLGLVPERWYCLAADGMATLCASEQDARMEAARNDHNWPRHAPFRAVLLGDVAAERERWAPMVERLAACLAARLGTNADEWADVHAARAMIEA